ncbi:hypothetical protein DMC61_19760 [Amycolatopsis sp. WAC 04169]|nr:hypothetical protein DMC61_19760 [Amycolatopsis sp. WAC 04169]
MRVTDQRRRLASHTVVDASSIREALAIHVRASFCETSPQTSAAVAAIFATWSTVITRSIFLFAFESSLLPDEAEGSCVSLTDFYLGFLGATFAPWPANVVQAAEADRGASR